MDSLLQAMDEAQVEPADVDFIAVTHVHLDHSGGTAELLKHLPNVGCDPVDRAIGSADFAMLRWFPGRLYAFVCLCMCAGDGVGAPTSCSTPH